MAIAIESAKADDAIELANIHVTSSQVAYAGLMPEELYECSDLDTRARHWQKWLERSRVSTVLARKDGKAVGFCTLQPIRAAGNKGPAGEIVSFYVLPTHWRQGIGRRLCQRVLSHAQEQGYVEVQLWVLENNAPARRFYESLGFLPHGKTRLFLERPEESLHELRLRKEL